MGGALEVTLQGIGLDSGKPLHREFNSIFGYAAMIDEAAGKRLAAVLAR
jgi:hypothetical protein